MTTHEYKGPVPKPTPETLPYWEGTKQGKLLIQNCKDCRQHYFYARPLCPHCFSRNVEWVEASGRGKLHTYVISMRPGRSAPLPAPYVVAIIELDEGPKMMSNLVGVEPDPARIECDMPVEVVFEAISDDITLPRFRPVSA